MSMLMALTLVSALVGTSPPKTAPKASPPPATTKRGPSAQTLQDSDIVKRIKLEYARVESSRKKMKVVTLDTFGCEEGGEAKTYSDSRGVRLVTYSCMAFMYQRHVQIYLDNGAVFFVYARGLDYEEPLAQNDVTIPVEERLYLDGSRIVRWVHGPEKKRMPASSFVDVEFERERFMATTAEIIAEASVQAAARKPAPSPRPPKN